MQVFKAAPNGTPSDETPADGTPQATGWRGVRTWRWRLWVTRGIELLVLVFAVSLGGVSATSLLTPTVQTNHYRAEVRLSALRQFRPTTPSPPPFGDLDLEFASPY